MKCSYSKYQEAITSETNYSADHIVETTTSLEETLYGVRSCPLFSSCWRGSTDLAPKKTQRHKIILWSTVGRWLISFVSPGYYCTLGSFTHWALRKIIFEKWADPLKLHIFMSTPLYYGKLKTSFLLLSHAGMQFCFLKVCMNAWCFPDGDINNLLFTV